jgi:hypothetical protein
MVDWGLLYVSGAASMDGENMRWPKRARAYAWTLLCGAAALVAIVLADAARASGWPPRMMAVMAMAGAASMGMAVVAITFFDSQ